MIRTLGGIAMLSGLLVVLAYQVTFERIAENKRLALERAIFEVVPDVSSETTTRVSFSLGRKGLVRLDPHSGDANLYALYDASGGLVGIAMEGAAQGYQDVVRTLYGYKLECQCIVGMTVVESKETPGLGDKVETDPEFLANFEALDARLNADQTALAHPIETVKHGTKTEPWQIDAISGATITSKAIGKGLRASTDRMLPLLAEHLAELKAAHASR